MQSIAPSDTDQATARGLEEVTVIVNRSGAHRRKRFVGQLLVRWLQPTDDAEGTEILRVYLTARQQYALHTRTIPDWDISEGDPDYWGNPENWGVKDGWLRRLMGFGWDWETFKESGDYSLQVFKTREELRGRRGVGRLFAFLVIDIGDAKELARRTLTNLYNERPAWLDAAHKRLDAAVFDAYGWPHDLSNEEILARLLALNLERAGKSHAA